MAASWPAAAASLPALQRGKSVVLSKAALLLRGRHALLRLLRRRLPVEAPRGRAPILLLRRAPKLLWRRAAKLLRWRAAKLLGRAGLEGRSEASKAGGRLRHGRRPSKGASRELGWPWAALLVAILLRRGLLVPILLRRRPLVAVALLGRPALALVAILLRWGPAPVPRLHARARELLPHAVLHHAVRGRAQHAAVPAAAAPAAKAAAAVAAAAARSLVPQRLRGRHVCIRHHLLLCCWVGG